MAKKKAPLKVEYVPIGKLKPFVGNPRKNEEAVAEIVKSIEFYGYTNPILVRWANKEVIAGHTRLLALKETGATEAPVIYLNMSSDQAHAYGIFDNKSTENTEWDVPKLVDLIDELKVAGLDLDKMGITDVELLAMQPQDEIGDAWGGMPTFNQEDKTAFRSVVVHFKDQVAVDEFAELLGQTLSDKTKMMWFPKIEIERYADKVYADAT